MQFLAYLFAFALEVAVLALCLICLIDAITGPEASTSLADCYRADVPSNS